jgi:hypothetical protein
MRDGSLSIDDVKFVETCVPAGKKKLDDWIDDRRERSCIPVARIDRYHACQLVHGSSSIDHDLVSGFGLIDGELDLLQVRRASGVGS